MIMNQSCTFQRRNVSYHIIYLKILLIISIINFLSVNACSDSKYRLTLNEGEDPHIIATHWVVHAIASGFITKFSIGE